MENNKRVTAVEWLFDKLPTIDKYDPYYADIIEQAKAMEKEQIMEAVDVGFDDGSNFIEDIKFANSEQYYNETYGK